MTIVDYKADNVCNIKYDRRAYGSAPNKNARKASIHDARGKDYYTGLTLDPAKTDVDHLIPLKAAHPRMCAFPYITRVAWGNDLLNLRATSASINRSKSDQMPDTWAPASKQANCKYLNDLMRVIKKWQLESILTYDMKQSIDRGRRYC